MLSTAGNVARIEGVVPMDSHTTVNCIEVLKKLLDVYKANSMLVLLKRSK